ncbi:hypothetical protein PO124_19550 [Bacillus licheniformis]|nr:hypothetical protein [Bacillus licheniformis]
MAGVLSARSFGKSESAAMWQSIIAGVICIIAAIPCVIIGAAGNSTDWSLFGASAPDNPAMICRKRLRI